MFVIEDTNTLFALDTNLNDIYIGRNLFYQISSFFISFFFQGSFQQMWISKQEYEDQGKGCVERKCP